MIFFLLFTAINTITFLLFSDAKYARFISWLLKRKVIINYCSVFQLPIKQATIIITHYITFGEISCDHVCMCVCVCECSCVCIHLFVCVCVCAWVGVCVFIYVCICVRLRASVRACVLMCLNVCMCLYV